MPEKIATPEAPAAPVPTPEPVAAAPVTPVAPVTPAVTPTPATDISLGIDDRLSLTPGQRKGLLFNKPVATEDKPPEVVPPVPPVVPPAEVPPVDPAVVPPAEVPPAVPPPIEDDVIDPATGFTKNFRLHTDDPQQSAFLKAFKAASSVNPNLTADDITNIARSVGLKSAPGQPAAAAPAAEIPGIEAAPQPPAAIVAARAEIDALVAKIDAAVTDGVLTTPEIAKMHREYADKRAALGTLELRHELHAQQQAERAQGQAVTARQSEMAAVETAFPALTDPESDLSLELDRQFFQITGNPSHPDYARVNSEGFPAYITEQAAEAVAARLMKKTPGMTRSQALAAVKGAAAPVSPAPVPAAPVAAKPTQPAPVPRTVLVTAPGGQAAPAAVQLSIEQIREQAAKDPHFRRRALGFTGDRIVA